MALVAASGPLFCTVLVALIVVPGAIAPLGEAVVVIVRSACGTTSE